MRALYLTKNYLSLAAAGATILLTLCACDTVRTIRGSTIDSPNHAQASGASTTAFPESYGPSGAP